MQDDDTVLRLARKSSAMSALSFIDSHNLPPAAVLEPYRKILDEPGRWSESGPVALIALLGLLGLLPALVQGRPPAFDNAVAFVLVWLAAAGIILLARHGRRPDWAPSLRQMAWVLPAAIPILMFRPFDIASQITAAALFTGWGVLYYLIPASALRLKLSLALAASAVFFALTSIVVTTTALAAGPALALPFIGLLAIVVIVMNVLGGHFSGALHHLRMQAHVQRHLIDLLQDELNTLAETDELTGLASRKRALEILQQQWDQNASNTDTAARPQMSLIMVDVDYLAELNEHYGRHIGDVCLTRIASQLRSYARSPADCVARYAGTSFLLILQGCDERRAVQTGEKIRRAIESMNMLNPKSPAGWVVTVSVGVCGCVPRPGYACADAVQDVKSILARAKASGRNRVYSRQGMESGARAVPHFSPGDITQLLSSDDTTLRRRRVPLQIVH